jgi:hypothetical protein
LQIKEHIKIALKIPQKMTKSPQKITEIPPEEYKNGPHSFSSQNIQRSPQNLLQGKFCYFCYFFVAQEPIIASYRAIYCNCYDLASHCKMIV